MARRRRPTLATLSVVDLVARATRIGVPGTGLMGRGRRKRGRAKRAVGFARFFDSSGRLHNRRRSKR